MNMKKNVKMPHWKCERCGHTWVPRTEEVPRTCPHPKCRSIYWDIPRKHPKRTQVKKNGETPADQTIPKSG